MSTADDHAPLTNQPAPVTPSQPFHLSRVLKLVAIPLVLFVLIAVGVALGWEDVVQGLFQPRLVAVTGEVQFQGKPLASGFVSTRYLDGRGGTALGPLDDEGRFTLSTNGTPGAFVGRHKVLVHCMGEGMPPPSLIPEKYSREEATPLTREVTLSKDKNHWNIKLDDQ